MMDRNELLAALSASSGGRIDDFRDGQWEAIVAACVPGSRTLLVQRTGWGKSLVYFGATRRLRAAGAGPTLLISPLVALMRDQGRAALEYGVQARFMNHENQDAWVAIAAELAADAVDILFLSPEKLGNDDFLEEYILPHIARVPLFVVDEVHCISDWGHEFRPDYRRIRRLITGRLAPGVSVIACTATANNRVVNDLEEQLGGGPFTLRGLLGRETLQLQVTALPHRAERYAWLAQTLPTLEGSGIIYVQTRRDADRLADWLRQTGLAVEAYHSGGDDGDDERAERKIGLEDRLRANEVKALVATQALGMGFDKPDLAFVIHFQAPMSVVQYYQQVGRAGRSIPQAYGVLLTGAEDESIVRYFIDNAFPPEQDIRAILDALENASDGLRKMDLEARVDLPSGRIQKILKQLELADEPAVYYRKKRWYRSTNAYAQDYERIAHVTDVRNHEWQRIKDYAATSGCRMEFLTRELDDPHAAPCGQCDNCLGAPLLNPALDTALVQGAVDFMRRSGMREIRPRRKWADYTNIHTPLETGRVLSVWGDPGYAEEVARGKHGGRFSDALVAASAELITEEILPQVGVRWVTCIPSLRTPGLVPDFARRLADALGLEFREALEKVKNTAPQKSMVNSHHQANNVLDAFAVVDEELPEGPCLLVDDMVDSRWSLTVCGVLLREASVPAVVPFALADTGRS